MKIWDFVYIFHLVDFVVTLYFSSLYCNALGSGQVSQSTFTRCEVILPRNEMSWKIKESDFLPNSVWSMFEGVRPLFENRVWIFLKIKLVKQNSATLDRKVILLTILHSHFFKLFVLWMVTARHSKDWLTLALISIICGLCKDLKNVQKNPFYS